MFVTSWAPLDCHWHCLLLVVIWLYNYFVIVFPFSIFHAPYDIKRCFRCWKFTVHPYMASTKTKPKHARQSGKRGDDTLFSVKMLALGCFVYCTISCESSSYYFSMAFSKGNERILGSPINIMNTWICFLFGVCILYSI